MFTDINLDIDKYKNKYWGKTVIEVIYHAYLRPKKEVPEDMVEQLVEYFVEKYKLPILDAPDKEFPSQLIECFPFKLWKPTAGAHLKFIEDFVNIAQRYKLTDECFLEWVVRTRLIFRARIFGKND